MHLESKLCSKCLIHKHTGEFYKNSRTKSGLYAWCKDCVRQRNTQPEQKAKRLAAVTRWNAGNKDKIHDYNVSRRIYTADYHLKRKYNITVSDKDAMLLQQNGCCAICKSYSSGGYGWCVDHDHRTGEVRGLLCNNCNRGIGHLKDSPDVVYSAYQYLMSYEAGT